MSSSLNPTEGVRLLLERREVESAEQARYEGKIYTVDSCFAYTAVLQMNGSASLQAEGVAASTEDEEKLAKLAKSTARAAKRKLDARLPPWPPRILRWRGPGRG